MKSNGWQPTPLGRILKRNEHCVTIDPVSEYKEVTIRLWGKGVILRRLAAGSAIASERRFSVRPMQFIVSRIDARNGAMGLVPSELEGAVVSNDFPTYDINADIAIPEYLGWLSKTHSFVDACRTASEGTTNRVRLQESRFLALQVPLPPLPEQRRIVAKIKRLAAKIDEAQSLRVSANHEMDALASANSKNCFTFQTEAEVKQIHSFAEVAGGIQKCPGREAIHNPVRYLTVAHVMRNRILLDNPRYFEVTPTELSRRKLSKGDVLIIEGNGSADQIGRTALFRGEIDPCVHQNHVIRIRADQTIVDPNYLNSFLNSPKGQEEVQRRSRTTSGLRSLSVGRIKTIEVPIPPKAEQRRIVAYLDGLQTKVDQLKRLAAESAEKLDALLPALLDRAFKGQL